MKRSISVLFALGCFVQPVWAANNVNLTNFYLNGGQAAFKAFSEDMGSALSYKPITPPTPLGITGFDIGLEVTSTKMRNLDIATNSSMTNLVVPKLHIYKGLPLNFDIGAFYSAVPTTNIRFYGGELRYAILEGGVALPAVGIRGALTKLTGVSQLALTTKSLDISVSKGFAIFTPYAGVGRVWVDSTPDVAGLTKETFQQGKVFVGGNINLGAANVALEYDKTGTAPSYSAKLGFRF
jgi:hypothetical protein